MKKKQKKKIIILGIIGIILIAGGIITYCVLSDDDNPIKDKIEEILDPPKEELKVIDVNSDKRVFAVSIGNTAAARPQSGIQDAFIVYNLVVEGGITRLLALFRDSNISAIGPVRSARHYFIDYALENDAMLVHCGYSPQAQSDISSLKINNLNLESNVDSSTSWRDKSKSAPHNLFTNMEKLEASASKKKYKTESEKLLLDYSASAVDLSTGTDTTKVVVPFGGSFNVTYEYDSENQVYLRTIGNSKHVDKLTNSQLKVKNIIAYGLDYSAIAGDSKDRQNLANTGTGKGYYISNGKSIEITWTKESRSAQTKYTTADGKELVVNDGNTFFEIFPKENDIKFN